MKDTLQQQTLHIFPKKDALTHSVKDGQPTSLPPGRTIMQQYTDHTGTSGPKSQGLGQITAALLHNAASDCHTIKLSYGVSGIFHMIRFRSGASNADLFRTGILSALEKASLEIQSRAFIGILRDLQKGRYSR